MVLFHVGTQKKSSFDTIMFDHATVKGAAQVCDDDVESAARFTYFFFAKLLHEIAHACVVELGLKLPIGDPMSINPIPDSIGSCRIQSFDKIRLVPVGFR
jgi:hypothetical protein